MTAARKLHGDLADDIDLLASDGKVIRRHDGMYRLNGATENLTAAMVRGMAAEMRNRRLDAATTPRTTKAGHEIVSGRGPDDPRARMARHEITKTREGTPAGDGAGTPVEGRAGSTIAKTCTKCGGPRSKESKGLCVGCYTPKGCPPNPKPPTAERPDKFWRAVGPSESTKLQGPMPNAGDGGETAATRCRPSPFNPDAAPSGRADVVHTDVPPAGTPQTASGPPTAAVTPAPESGASAGTISDALTANPLGAYCGCGALRSHTGRCWHRRGLTGPESAEQTPHKRSRTRKHRKAAGIPARILALENANDALKRKIAALEALMSMEGLR